MTTKPFHSSMRVACSALLPSILAALGVALAAPQPGVADKKADDDGSIFEAVEDETMVRLKRILDADPNAWKARNGVKNQPLHLAAEAGNNGAVGLLLERGADVTARGDGGWTALHYAAEEGHPETCRILLKAGAKRGALCDFGLKAMDYAKDPETRLALKSDNILVPGVKDFLTAAATGDLETVQTMLKSTPDLLNAKGAEGKTAVMEAAARNRVDLLKWLIEAGADIDLMTEEDVTALYLATDKGHLETVKLLLDHEVEVNPPPTNESDLRATPSSLSVATTFMVVSERGTRAASATAEGDSTRENLNDSIKDAWGTDAAMKVFWNMFQDVEEPLRSRRTEIAKLLIAAGAKPDIIGRGAPLVAASLGRQVEIVRLLLEAGADPNRRMGGITPLIGSVYMQAPEAQFRLLLEKGADPHLPAGEPKDPENGKEPDSPDGPTTLEFTASMGEVASFRVMFESLDTTKLSDKQKTELLEITVRKPELLKIVLAAGFDVNLANEEKRTALHYAVFESAESVRMLLEAGADVKARDRTGYAPIHYAAEKGSTEIVKILLAKDPSQIEFTTGGDTTPLIHACGKGDNAETVAFLIGKGANMEAAFGPDKMTALMYCALWGRADSADVLIKAGADIKVTSNAHGLLGTAVSCASERLAASGRPTKSKPGTKEDYLRIAALLIERGADVNQVGDGKGKGALPLANALRSGSVAMVKLLLKHGADADIANKNDAGRNPLWVTIELGDMELFGLIFDEIDDVDAKDVAKNTPLHFAATLDQPEMVKALLKRGARINAREENGATPLMMAVAFSARKSARTLLEAGADRTIPDRVEVTPMQRAEQLNDDEMINMLTTVKKK